MFKNLWDNIKSLFEEKKEEPSDSIPVEPETNDEKINELTLINSAGNGSENSGFGLCELYSNSDFLTEKEIWLQDHKGHNVREGHMDGEGNYSGIITSSYGVVCESCKLIYIETETSYKG